MCGGGNKKKNTSRGWMPMRHFSHYFHTVLHKKATVYEKKAKKVRMRKCQKKESKTLMPKPFAWLNK
jgi:hypothetical protein